ncbi:MAG: hypothetical protein CFE23_11745 [Flavobacterium sp. BFFFF1]|uniref:T9SS type A sorting domain-containing protein n=1 Tax=Flavobacterium sp. BFFFF1 TaxID=2015557 RepID=UPI000BC67D95|nr:T9SS type A sorting domain-containing protein [Flavobacterium sp. BFFFF1]OYU79921.1 MAG: hypothetical protein CFE23_11745 [Flavobacterium sp. BFFFF1]
MRKSLLLFSFLLAAAVHGQQAPINTLSGVHATRHSAALQQTPTATPSFARVSASIAATVGQAVKSEYTRVPLGQAAQAGYGAAIVNTGGDDFTGVVRLRVMDPTMAVVATASSAPTLVTAGTTSAVLAVTPSYTPAAPGVYTYTYDILVDGTSDVASTADVTYTVQFTASEMARDNDVVGGALGIGAGDGGYLGQSFALSSDTTLSSVSIFTVANNQGVAVEMGCAVFKLVGGVPQLLQTLPSIMIPSLDPAGWHDFALATPLEFNAGDVIVVCAQEYGQTIQVGLTNTIFTAGSTYVNWPSNPFGTWAPNEQFGAAFAKPYMIRPSFSCSLPDPIAAATQSFCEGATVADLDGTGTNIEWFDAIASAAALTPDTVLVTQTYYVSQSQGLCSSDRVPVSVTVTPITSNVTTISACDSYTWDENATTYTASGTYNVVNGCHTETLNLTVTPSTSNTAVVEACDSYTWPVNGFTYTESGSYDVTNGCHTEILELTITPSTSNTAVVEACDSYTWAVNGFTYTESGSYDVTNGCHTEILELTILLPVNILDQPADQNLVEGTTASFSVIADNAATYQWQGSIDGGANWIDIPEGDGISGTDTNTLTIDGTVVTTGISGLMVRAFMTNGTCSTAFTNSAVLSVTLGTNTAALNNLSIYPNPTRNLVNVSTNGVAAKITVSDINGRLIHSAASQTGEAQIDLSNVQAGIYLFTITTDYGVVNKKVIKE